MQFDFTLEGLYVTTSNKNQSPLKKTYLSCPPQWSQNITILIMYLNMCVSVLSTGFLNVFLFL